MDILDSQSIGLKLKAFLPALLALRQDLHRHPELSGEEFATAERIRYFMAPFQPDAIIENIGGYGLVFVFEGSQPGPTVLFRCELDALPIKEVNTFNYRSVVSGASHKCGHDGHMTIICALGVLLAGKRPEKGRVLLAFQGAEETGQGAVAMVEDPLFQPLKPDYAFALHNLPPFPGQGSGKMWTIHLCIQGNDCYPAGQNLPRRPSRRRDKPHAGHVRDYDWPYQIQSSP